MRHFRNYVPLLLKVGEIPGPFKASGATFHRLCPGCLLAEPWLLKWKVPRPYPQEDQASPSRTPVSSNATSEPKAVGFI